MNETKSVEESGRPYSIVYTGKVQNEPEFLTLDRSGATLFCGDLPIWKLAEPGERVMIVVVRVDDDSV